MKNNILKLTAAYFLFLPLASNAGPVFDSASYAADIVFTDVLGSTTMTVAFDGSNYWSASGGSASGDRYAQYDAAGSVVSTYAPGLDFRSVFTDASGNVHARAFSDPTIYSQTSPGVFAPLLSLSGGSLDAQSSVVLDDDGNFVAMDNGAVDVWDPTGALLSSFTLTGYTGGYPENRGIAAAGGYLFTYFSGLLTAWDYSGNLLDEAVLTDAGSSFDSHFSLSYANDHIFVVDAPGSAWRGYDIGLGVAVPEPGTLALLGLGLAGLGLVRRRKQP